MVKRLFLLLFMIPYGVIIVLMMVVGVLTAVPIYWIITGNNGFDEFTDTMYHIMIYPLNKR